VQVAESHRAVELVLLQSAAMRTTPAKSKAKAARLAAESRRWIGFGPCVDVREGRRVMRTELDTAPPMHALRARQEK